MSRLGIDRAAGTLASVLVAVTLGCSSEPSPAAGESADAGAGVRGSVAESAAARARIDELRARFLVRPASAPVLAAAQSPALGPHPALAAGTALAFERHGDAQLAAVLPALAKRGVLRAATAVLPRRASGAVELEDDTTHVALSFVLAGTRNAEVEVAGGLALYRGALDGSDVVHRVHAEGTEDYVVFEQHPAQEQLTYDVDVSRVAGLRLVENVLEFLDEGGAPRLRMAAPWVMDATGARREATTAITGCAYDRDASAPWGRPVTKPGARTCGVTVTWTDVVYPAIVDPSWVATGSMTVPRYLAAVAALPSGNVLVAGGVSGASHVSTAELFDGTSSFAATGSMTGPRIQHSATLLPSGKVLVAGGVNVTTTLSSAELFNGTSSFSATGSLVVARGNHTATLLPSGKVLIAGGSAALSTELSSAELFDGTSTFSVTGSMTAPRGSPSATLLPSGSVLIAGGSYTLAIASTAELFTGSTFAATGSMSVPRSAHSATLLQSGKVLIAGGLNGSAYESSAELFDGTSSFTSTSSMAVARAFHSATLLGTGAVLVAGGGNSGSNYLSDAELFDGAASFLAAPPMATRRSYSAATLLPSGKVLLAGGNGATLLSSAELFQLTSPGGGCVIQQECASGLCDLGICCSAACGTCQRCAAGTGACSAVTSADDADSCIGTRTCDATGACKLKTGQPSIDATACLSGFASDGYCCNAACVGPCNACGQFFGATANGVCTLLSTGNPGLPACGGGFACNGSSGACPAPTCASDADCLTTHYCAPSGTCTPQRAQGVACDTTVDCRVSGCRECGTGHCADGVCCDQTCSGTCSSCLHSLTVTLPDGTCGSVASNRPPPHGTCPVSGGPCGPNNTCNGTGACAAAAPAGTLCSAGTCSGNLLNGSTCDGAGTCNAGSPVNCFPYACAAGNCNATCATVADCAAGAQCSNNNCVVATLKTNGAACAAGTECQSGYCVEGVCCDGLCDGSCQSCLGSLKASGSSGTCGSIKKATDPKDGCAPGGTACGATGSCDGQGSCQQVADVATACGAPSCAGGVQTQYACNGSGACQTSPTNCFPYACTAGACSTTCTVQADCAAGTYCNNGSCIVATLKANGVSCVAGADCQSSFCVDGVCCDGLCDGACQSCLGALKASGSSGTCGPIKKATDPKDGCPDGTTACGATGLCDGQGACQLSADVGTSCGAPTCAGSSRSTSACDNAGACSPSATPCDPFGCRSGACLASCGNDPDCATGYRCSSGTCVAKIGTGQACTTAGDCTSGFCADGVCCDSPCTGQCQACDGAPSVGSCTTVTGTPHNHAACAGTAPCGGTCDGVNAAACSYPSGTVCATSCASQQESDSTCDGKGACVDGTTKGCAPYVCDGTTKCKTACAADADCATGNSCIANVCSPTGTSCQDDHTVLDSHGTATACDPYKCAGGRCGDSCSSVNDCVAPNICDSARKLCVQPSKSAAADQGGCGCRAASDGREGGWSLLVLVSAIAAARRRRRWSATCRPTAPPSP